jgi:alpha-tubulin suppressor-like RCC1 family protein
MPTPTPTRIHTARIHTARILAVLLALLLSVGTLPAPAAAQPTAPHTAPHTAPDTAFDRAAQPHQVFLPTLLTAPMLPHSLAPGGAHTCALTTTGAALCWGYNDSGQLGDGTTTDRRTPAPVSSLGSGVAALAAGGYHTCALTAVGAVLCWGLNNLGQLGNGTTGLENNRLTPAPVSGLGSGVTALATGDYHTCALTAAGGVLCWGANYGGQLGDGTTTDRLIPTPVSGLDSGVAAITAGSSHTCALTAVGDVLCWGSNHSDELDNGTSGLENNRLTPTPVSGLGSGVAAITAGGYHTCALTAAGGVLCWGANYGGQLGDGSAADRLTPAPVSGLASGVAAITAGGYHTCALTAADGVLCWGSNWSGQLGDGTTTDRLTPAPVSGLGSVVTAIAAGGEHTCALTAAGAVLCWGSNWSGQLGDGTSGLENNRPTPTPVLWP